MSKSRKKPEPKAKNPDELRVIQDQDDKAAMMARTVLRPSVTAGVTLKTLMAKEWPDADLTALVNELGTLVKQANEADLNRAEAMLDALFNNLARRAACSEYLNQYDTYMKFALRAQSQCRATVETLAAIKNPQPVAFVRQANIANGPQQVNNATPATPEPSRAGESQNQQNKLLEDLPNERLDTGTQDSAGRADPSLETVGAVNGTEDGGR